jgi:hypothetical protein
MGHKLSKEDAELYRRVDEVLHYMWDPIGVAGAPYARDEYRSYLPQVFALLKSSASGGEIADLLLGIEQEAMQLHPDRKRAQMVAEILLEYRKKIFE